MAVMDDLATWKTLLGVSGGEFIRLTLITGQFIQVVQTTDLTARNGVPTSLALLPKVKWIVTFLTNITFDPVFQFRSIPRTRNTILYFSLAGRTHLVLIIKEESILTLDTKLIFVITFRAIVSRMTRY